MLDWARQWADRRWAIENARGLGHHLTPWLLARGEQVVDVPPSATARVRQLSEGVKSVSGSGRVRVARGIPGE